MAAGFAPVSPTDSAEEPVIISRDGNAPGDDAQPHINLGLSGFPNAILGPFGVFRG